MVIFSSSIRLTGIRVRSFSLQASVNRHPFAVFFSSSIRLRGIRLRSFSLQASVNRHPFVVFFLQASGLHLSSRHPPLSIRFYRHPVTDSLQASGLEIVQGICSRHQLKHLLPRGIRCGPPSSIRSGNSSRHQL